MAYNDKYIPPISHRFGEKVHEAIPLQKISSSTEPRSQPVLQEVIHDRQWIHNTLHDIQFSGLSEVNKLNTLVKFLHFFLLGKPLDIEKMP